MFIIGLVYYQKGMKQKRCTIKQVAEEAGVSTATVSRYLNNSRQFPEDVKDRIRNAIDALHYAPNANARSLKKNETRVIGMIIPDMIVYNYICKTIEQILCDNDYSLIIATSNFEPRREAILLQRLFQQHVDGILLASCGQNDDYIRFIENQGVPIVLFDRILPTLPDMNYVLEKGVECIRKVTEYAISQGHRSFAYLQGPADAPVSQERFEEFLRILQNHGISPNHRFYYPDMLSQEDIRDASNDIIDHLDEVTIVITTNAKQIKHFIMTAHERGFEIPDDISITGFGLDEYKTLFSRPITCIIQNHAEIGEQCANMMLGLVNNNILSHNKILVDSEFFIGKSVRYIG